MKAIFVGSLSAGFQINAVVEDDKAEDLVIASLSNGQLAEAIDVQSPDVLDKSFSNLGGIYYVLFGSGIGNGGFTVFGPFHEHDIAEEFAEKNRGPDEWEIFVLNRD